MTVNVSLVVVDLPVGGGVMVVVASSFTRIANSVASGDRAMHVKRSGKKQPTHHCCHQLSQAASPYLIYSDLDAASSKIRQVVCKVIVHPTDSAVWVRIVTDGDPSLGSY
jgi:hypothetical protein